MGLKRLGVKQPTAGIPYMIADVNVNYFASVIITNCDLSKTANVTVWVKPVGTSAPSEYAYIIYNFPIKRANSFETQRFALNALDEIWIESDINQVSFVLEGIPQPDLTMRYSIGVSSKRPPTPAIGDQFFDTLLDELQVYTSLGWQRATLTEVV